MVGDWSTRSRSHIGPKLDSQCSDEVTRPTWGKWLSGHASEGHGGLIRVVGWRPLSLLGGAHETGISSPGRLTLVLQLLVVVVHRPYT